MRALKVAKDNISVSDFPVAKLLRFPPANALLYPLGYTLCLTKISDESSSFSKFIRKFFFALNFCC